MSLYKYRPNGSAKLGRGTRSFRRTKRPHEVSDKTDSSAHLPNDGQNGEEEGHLKLQEGEGATKAKQRHGLDSLVLGHAARGDVEEANRAVALLAFFGARHRLVLQSNLVRGQRVAHGRRGGYETKQEGHKRLLRRAYEGPFGRSRLLASQRKSVP
jgi:hypothetical protein